MEKIDMVETLESHVDNSSLLDVMVALELLCIEKADHIRMNYGNEALAKAWERKGRVCYRAAKSLEKEEN